MKRFNLRVYAIIQNADGAVLVSDERRSGNAFTKFPGGGLEWGEGLKDCLKRELQEELGINATIGDLFYATDFFQQSAFRKEDQLFSFYYSATPVEGSTIKTTEHTIPLQEEGEAFRWVDLDQVHPEMFTFPIDKIVAAKISEQLNH